MEDNLPAPKDAFQAISRTTYTSKDSLSDLLDGTLKLATNIKIFENVPIISYAVKFLNVKDAYHLHKLQRNVAEFVRAVQDADQQKMKNFFEKFEKDEAYSKEFSDTALSILVEATKPIKAHLVGRLVKTASLGCITIQELDFLSQIIQAASVPALLALPSFFAKTEGKPFIHNERTPEEPLLFSIGLASRHGSLLRISEYGEKLFLFGFEGRIDRGAKEPEEPTYLIAD